MISRLEIINPFIDKTDHLSPSEFTEYVSENPDVVIIDLRSNNEYNAGHIRNAINIERGYLETSATEKFTNPNAKIVLYCIGGGISAMAQLTLKSYGYKNVIDIAGGVKNYTGKGFSLYNILGEFKMKNFGALE